MIEAFGIILLVIGAVVFFFAGQTTALCSWRWLHWW